MKLNSCRFVFNTFHYTGVFVHFQSNCQHFTLVEVHYFDQYYWAMMFFCTIYILLLCI